MEAAVKPLRTKRGNKLGFYLHLSNDQHGLWEAIRRVEPPVLLIHADTANSMLLQDIRRFRAPNAFVIGRLYKDGHTQRQMLESDNPEAQGRALAEEILNYNFGLATQRGANGRLLIDAWMSLNEAVPGPGSDQFKQQPAETSRLLRNYDRFQVAFRERLQIAGVEAIAFNFGAGNFGLAEHYLAHFPNTLAHYVYLGFHEYGWPTLYPTDGSATSGGTYRRCMEGIRVFPFPVSISGETPMLFASQYEYATAKKRRCAVDSCLGFFFDRYSSLFSPLCSIRCLNCLTII